MNDGLPPPAALPGAEGARLEQEALAIIDRVLRAELNLDRPARPEDGLAADLQLDSVGLLTLVVELENRFRVALREEDATEVRTVRDLCALVAARVLEGRAAPDTDVTTNAVTNAVTNSLTNTATNTVADIVVDNDAVADAAVDAHATSQPGELP